VSGRLLEFQAAYDTDLGKYASRTSQVDDGSGQGRRQPGFTSYAGAMLRSMRDESGGPNVKIRLVALLAAVGLLVVTAPAVIALVRWIANLIW
jgi:hypothetical protein